MLSSGLQDEDDDVRAVAAEALLPIVELTVVVHYQAVGSVCSLCSGLDGTIQNGGYIYICRESF